MERVVVENSMAEFEVEQRLWLTNEQATTVKQIAEQEAPPQAPSRKKVKEDCQGWAVRVLARLAENGIVGLTKS
ncbi:hypothetical protein D8B26_002812 [Coccidioides posadasii str. Silveira]|uniref:uncharacterized protein n=1 Tax=Coccidioides posadasii (strain RMSCC 757 / Silveira) TaxID=443226 RepID=UPI001BF1803B|nr:hypothetical protein D8B26_002812 [Coccidioides posadasii str. Silveira]